jgi:hypothetical protein
MKSLESLPIVKTVMRLLQPDNQYTLLMIASKLGVMAHVVAPVVWEMQRAGMIETTQYPGSPNVYYKIKDTQDARRPPRQPTNETRPPATR